MAQSALKVLVSIVNWNDSAGTNRCLAGIAGIPKADQPDVVVVDNGSRREPLKIDQHIKLRSLRIINNPSNIGFAAGHNPNIKTAKQEGYDYVLLLNNDTEIIDRRIFTKLSEALENDELALAANPTILKSTDPDLIWYGGGRLSLKSGSASHLNVGQTYEAGESPARTDLLTGGCMMIALKRTNLSQLLLREDYFLYWEDTDWCARSRRAGFKLLYVPNARLLHKVSSALGTRSPFYIYYNVRNHLLFIHRNIPSWFWPLAWASLAFIVAKYKFNIIFRYRDGRWSALMALWAGWRDGWLGRTGQTRRVA